MNGCSATPRHARSRQQEGVLLISSMSYFRLPNLAHVLGSRRIQRDHLRRLIVQENEAERTLYKAMTHDQTLPLDIRLQVCQ